MAFDPRFGPSAQTPQQRANVLRQMQLEHPRLKNKAPAHVQPLYEGYIAGELSWADVRRALDDPAT